MMARVAVLTQPDAVLPASFDLVAHQVQRLDALSGPLDEDVVVVDARRELTWARDLCLRLTEEQSMAPVLLLADPQSLPVLTPEWGFSDFILDGAQPGELDARIRLLLRGATAPSSVIECGPLVIDQDAYTATVDGVALELTYTEFELLKYLALHPGRVLTREMLLSEVWGYDYYGGTRTVDVHIRRLRAKLGAEYDAHITTVRNVGYRFSASR